MTNDQKWEHVASALATMEKYDHIHDAAINAVKLPPESPLVEPFCRMQALAINTLDALIGDKHRTIEWFVIECDYGKKPQDAGPSGYLHPIKTIADLRWLCEVQK